MSALLLSVVHSEPIHSQLQRLTLTGFGLERIPEDFHGKHIKLFFKRPEQAKLNLPVIANGKVTWPEPALKPVARSYSIYCYDRTNNHLVVDFVLHQPDGIASRFAREAKPGDSIGFAGPGNTQLVDRSQSQFLLTGDLSALPAVAAIAESLESPEQLKVFLELPEKAAAQTLIHHYFPNTASSVTCLPQRFQPEQTLLTPVRQAVATMDISKASFMLAGEHSTVVCLRKALRELDVTNAQMYVTPYWRHQFDEDNYHEERHQVMDS